MDPPGEYQTSDAHLSWTGRKGGEGRRGRRKDKEAGEGKEKGGEGSRGRGEKEGEGRRVFNLDIPKQDLISVSKYLTASSEMDLKISTGGTRGERETGRR
jgi:hypothetical protein